MKSWIKGGLVGLAASAAWAQSFNIDMNVFSGAGASVPSNTFKGAAGQAGTWSSVGTTSPITLVGLNGAAGSVTLSRSGGGVMATHSTGALSGDFEKLLEDSLQNNSGQPVTFTFNGLQAGTYALYTYAIDPTSPTPAIVNVAGSTSQTDQNSGSFMSSPSFFVGATHALHIVNVGGAGTLAVTIAPTGGAVDVAGMQLVKLSGNKLRMYVEDSAAGALTGSSWADAFTHPSTALRNAWVAGGANCEIWVGNGFYKPSGFNSRFDSFDIPSGLQMYGGFTGSETSPAQRGLLLTYLDGDIGDTSTDSDNCYNVVVADNTSADTLLDGFRIHSGYNNDGGSSGGKGAGIRMLSGNMTVRNCTFVGNNAVDLGAAVYAFNGSPTLIDCLFYDNDAFRGSAIYHAGPGVAKLYNCRFLANNTFEGTVYFDNADGVVANSYFHGNYAGAAGAALLAAGSASEVTMVNCTVAGNTAGQDAAVYARSSGEITLHNSILWENEAGLAQDVEAAQLAASGLGAMIHEWANIVEGRGGFGGSNPLFVDGDGADNQWGTFDDNCRLQEQSPAIDTGNFDNVPQDLGDLDQDGNTSEKLPLDFDGEVRIRGVVVDLGAFEYQPETTGLLGDMNCDGVLTVSDIAGFVLALTNPASYAAQFPNCDVNLADVNQDGSVTVSDIAFFVNLLTGV